MTPKELVESWKAKIKLIIPCHDYNEGVINGVLACADGLELEIKRSNFVSGNQVDVKDLAGILFKEVPNIYGCDVNAVIEKLTAKYHIIAK